MKYVLNSMKRRKLRTLVVALALVIGVALVGALLNLVDTQRQFAVQSVGVQTGGYDLSIRRSDLAPSPFFDPTPVEQLARAAYDRITDVYLRIQGSAEMRKAGGTQGENVQIIALDTQRDTLSPVTALFGSYPPQPGQVFLTSPAADALGVQVGDEVILSYVQPVPREPGKAASQGVSTARVEGRFIVSGIGVIGGVGGGLLGIGAAVPNSALMRLEDAQAWLGIPGQVERALVVWQTDTAAGSDAQLAVSRARDAGLRVRDAIQSELGSDFIVELQKYQQLDRTAQAFVFQQSFITLYGLLSMGIVGLMVNALMNTTVTEQKYDLAILRVLGAPRWRLFEAVVIEVIVLGTIGLVFGLLLGRLISDFIITPLLLSQLNLPPTVRAAWSLESVLTPTLITILVLAVATISPARRAASTKVMVVLNPAAADQPTLEDLAKLRERRPNYGLLVAGLILLAFCSVILFLFPVLFSFGDASAIATTFFTTFLLMVVGMSLVFYFITTPLERLLVALYNAISPRAGYFAGRYALRGKGRNALISLMIVASAVLPTLLATQLALTDANLETDLRFSRGAEAYARAAISTPGGIFRTTRRTGDRLDKANLADLRQQPGIVAAVGIADDFRAEVSDRAQLRSANVQVIGISGDLNDVLFREFMQWAQGDASALRRIDEDPNAVIISLGLSEALDLRIGDTLRVKGAGLDHERLLTIVAVGQRLPGFSSQITRNVNDARSGSTGILMNLETYRELRHDPASGPLDLDEPLFGRVLMRIEPSVDQAALGRALRESLGGEKGISVELTSELIASIRDQLAQGRIFTVVLTGLSMVTAVFGVLAVMYTAVMGRRVEIGMLKALGAPGRSLRGIFIGEAIIITLAAALAGIIAGAILGYAFEISQRFAQESPMLPAFDFSTAMVIVVMVSLAAIFSAALATQPVLRQKAVKILRER
ncbi:MAG: FtsX-like permease family protein [Candidatus Brachytrichaceae bacterium NZ_4S206]